ncbi:MAG: mechanosensitive ion channel family protein [Ramlibacter sp.]|nr:mechanosensitive ion channel family protein [Ramlibacter sp.]
MPASLPTAPAIRWLLTWLLIRLLPLASLLALAPAWAQQAPPAPSAEATLEVAHQAVATFRSSFNGADAAGRVARAQLRLDEARNRELPPNIELVPVVLDKQRGVAFRQGDVLLFTLTEADLEAGSGETLDRAAQATLARLGQALQAEAQQRQWPVVLRALGVALLETLLLAALLWGLWRMAQLAEDTLTHKLEAPSADSSQPAPASTFMQYAQSLLSRLVQLAALFVSAALVYFWVTSVLLAFPGTRALGERLGGLFLDTVFTLGEGMLRAIPGLVVVAVIILLAQAVVEASNALFRAVARRRVTVSFLHPETAAATRRLVALAIWALALVAAYPYLPGSSSEVFKGVSVLVGAMVTLGSSGVVNQLMSGLVLVYSRALRVGDHVVIGKDGEGAEGVVQEVGTLATKLKTMRNEEITIPNAVLVGNPIRNYSRLADTQGTMMSTKVTIGYDAPWRQVHNLLTGAAQATPGLRPAPVPFVLQRALGDFYVEYELYVYLDKPLERLYRLSELHQNIQDAFNAAGVQIMSPHFYEQPAQPVVVPPARWGG